jgi:O-antigen/teichoic acid export membrane protein
MNNLILKGTLAGLAAKAVASVATFFIIPLMLKQLGNTSYGIWMTISSTVALLTFFDLGIGNTLVNQVSQSGNNKDFLKQTIGAAYLIQLLLVVILACIFIAVFRYMDWGSILNLTEEMPTIYKVVFVSFILFLFSLVTNLIYFIQRALQKSHTANMWQLTSTLLYLVVMFFVLKYRPTLVNVALVSFGVPVFVSAVYTLRFMFTTRLVQISLSKSALSNSFSLLLTSRTFFYLQLASLLAFQADTLIVAHVLDFQSVSLYTITAKVFSIPTIVIGVYLATLWPAYGKKYAENNWPWLRRTFFRSSLGIYAAMVMFITTLYVFRDPLFSYWLQNRILIPAELILAFSFWSLVNITVDVLATFLNALNKLRIQIITSLFMIVFNLLFSILLSKMVGVTGVVYGSAIAMLCCCCIPMMLFLRRVFSNKNFRNPLSSAKETR